MDSNYSNCSKMSVESTATVSSTASGTKRKRGRQLTTGEYVGVKAAKQEALEMEIKLMEARAEREMAEMAYEARKTRSRTNELLLIEGSRGLSQPETVDISDETAEMEIEGITAIRKRIKNDLDVDHKSGNKVFKSQRRLCKSFEGCSQVN